MVTREMRISFRLDIASFVWRAPASRAFARALLTLLCLAICGTGAEAGELSERELLARCYAQLTGERLSARDPLYQQLASRRAADLCSTLLSEVRFGSDGVLPGGGTRAQRLVLRKMHEFHRGWFDNRWLMDARLIEGFFEYSVDIIDSEEPALFLTRALFADGVSYASVLRGTQGVRAIRDGAGATASGSASGFKRLSRHYTGAMDVSDVDFNLNQAAASFTFLTNDPETGATQFQRSVFATPFVQPGQLIGIQPDSQTALSPGIVLRPLSSSSLTNPPGLPLPVDVVKRQGGGALGTQMFLMTNFGHSFDYMPNGASKLPRTWVEAAFKTFLCRPGGYVRTSDVASFLLPATSGAPAFRQSAPCLRCHVTLDQGALVARNIVLGSTTNGEFRVTTPRTVASAVSFAPSRGASAPLWPGTPVTDFHLETPTGKLMFRSINGALVNRDVMGLDGLGTALSETDDYFACAAKRYVERFLGVKVDLRDDLDPGNSGIEVPPKDREMKEFVLALGKELKTTGSLKTLTKRIFESSYYKRSDFGR